MLTRFIVVVVLQYIHISIDYVAQLKTNMMLDVNYISINLGGKDKILCKS